LEEHMPYDYMGDPSKSATQLKPSEGGGCPTCTAANEEKKTEEKPEGEGPKVSGEAHENIGVVRMSQSTTGETFVGAGVGIGAGGDVCTTYGGEPPAGAMGLTGGIQGEVPGVGGSVSAQGTLWSDGTFTRSYCYGVGAGEESTLYGGVSFAPPAGPSEPYNASANDLSFGQQNRMPGPGTEDILLDRGGYQTDFGDPNGG
jgi:hypothetical protein